MLVGQHFVRDFQDSQAEFCKRRVGKLGSGAEAERGEDEIKHRYEEALKAVPGSAVEDVVRSQYERVKAGHDTIRDLRDVHK